MNKNLPADFNESLFYQKIGEFVVSFQWTEHLFRQIGWFTIDPDMLDFPNFELRQESNNELLNKVEMLHDEFIIKFHIDTNLGYQMDFPKTVAKFHEIRKFRNNLLHSAYHELKAGGEVVAMMRANPKLKKDPLTKDPIHDFDLIEANDVELVMKEMAPYVMHLSFYFTQLKHWYWAARKKTQTIS